MEFIVVCLLHRRWALSSLAEYYFFYRKLRDLHGQRATVALWPPLVKSISQDQSQNEFTTHILGSLFSASIKAVRI